MKKQLNAKLSDLIAMQERAETLADSENETTAQRYEQIVECLTSAIEAIEEAVAAFE